MIRQLVTLITESPPARRSRIYPMIGCARYAEWVRMISWRNPRLRKCNPVHIKSLRGQSKKIVPFLFQTGIVGVSLIPVVSGYSRLVKEGNGYSLIPAGSGSYLLAKDGSGCTLIPAGRGGMPLVNDGGWCFPCLDGRGRRGCRAGRGVEPGCGVLGGRSRDRRFRRSRFRLRRHRDCSRSRFQ